MNNLNVQRSGQLVWVLYVLLVSQAVYGQVFSLEPCPEEYEPPEFISALFLEPVSEDGTRLIKNASVVNSLAVQYFNSLEFGSIKLEERFSSVVVSGEEPRRSVREGFQGALDSALQEGSNVVAVLGMGVKSLTQAVSDLLLSYPYLHLDITAARVTTPPRVSRVAHYDYVTALVAASTLQSLGVQRCAVIRSNDTEASFWMQEFSGLAEQFGIDMEVEVGVPWGEYSGETSLSVIRDIKQRNLRYVILLLPFTEAVALLAHARVEGLDSVTWLADGFFNNAFDPEVYHDYASVDLKDTVPFSLYTVFQENNLTYEEIMSMGEGSLSLFDQLVLNEWGEYFLQDFVALTTSSTSSTTATTTTTTSASHALGFKDRATILLAETVIALGVVANIMEEAGYGCYLHHQSFSSKAADILFFFQSRLYEVGLAGEVYYNIHGDRVIQNYTLHGCSVHHRSEQDRTADSYPDRPHCQPWKIYDGSSGQILHDIPNTVTYWHDGSSTPPSTPPWDGTPIPSPPPPSSSSSLLLTSSSSGHVIAKGSPEYYAVAVGVPCLMGALLLVLVAFMIVWRRQKQMEDLMRKQLKSCPMNLDAPFTRTVKLLKRIVNGHKVSKRDALKLSMELLSANDLMIPNLEEQLRLGNSPYNYESSRFLVELFSRNNSRPKTPGRVAAELDCSEFDAATSPDTPVYSVAPYDVMAASHSTTPWRDPSSLYEILDSSHEVLENLGLGENLRLNLLEVYHFNESNALLCTAMFLFEKFELVQKLGLVKTKLIRFLQKVQMGYSTEVAYHNVVHAADVTQRLATIINKSKLYPTILDEEELVACLIAAVVHDYGHPGRTNPFLIATNHPFAKQHNDQHVLENNSLCSCLELLALPSTSFLEVLPLRAWQKIKTQVIQMVLATDMADHFTTISLFNSKVTEVSPAMRDDQKQLLVKMAIKVADLGHCTLREPEHVQWVRQLQKEFFLQGDAEKDLSLPVSALCDRKKPRNGPAAGENQIGFFDIVVIPLLEAWSNLIPSSSSLLEQARQNYEHWKRDSLAAERISVKVSDVKEITPINTPVVMTPIDMPSVPDRSNYK